MAAKTDRWRQKIKPNVSLRGFIRANKSCRSRLSTVGGGIDNVHYREYEDTVVQNDAKIPATETNARRSLIGSNHQAREHASHTNL